MKSQETGHRRTGRHGRFSTQTWRWKHQIPHRAGDCTGPGPAPPISLSSGSHNQPPAHAPASLQSLPCDGSCKLQETAMRRPCKDAPHFIRGSLTFREIHFPNVPALKRETHPRLLPPSPEQLRRKHSQQMVARGVGERGTKAPVQLHPQQGRKGASHNYRIIHHRRGSAPDRTPVPASHPHRGHTAPVSQRRKSRGEIRPLALGMLTTVRALSETNTFRQVQRPRSLEGELPEGMNAPIAV